MPRRAVVLLSGGLDSSTLLYHLMQEGWGVHALRVKYGQKHSQELDAALKIAQAAGVALTSAEVDAALFAEAKSSQVGSKDAVPEGHYTSPTMKLTIVPNRNMLLISMAGAIAASVLSQHPTDDVVVAYAAHAGDHPIYPDCRPEFIESCAETLIRGTEITLETNEGNAGNSVGLYAPFQDMTKADIVTLGVKLSVPFHLTYSCYNGGDIHCGKCSTCFERREAFQLAKVNDPTRYA